MEKCRHTNKLKIKILLVTPVFTVFDPGSFRSSEFSNQPSSGALSPGTTDGLIVIIPCF